MAMITITSDDKWRVEVNGFTRTFDTACEVEDYLDFLDLMEWA